MFMVKDNTSLWHLKLFFLRLMWESVATKNNHELITELIIFSRSLQDLQ